jgi:hypothetical protein
MHGKAVACMVWFVNGGIKWDKRREMRWPGHHVPPDTSHVSVTFGHKSCLSSPWLAPSNP